MSNFICQIWDASGNRLEIDLPQSHPAQIDMLNLLCSADPLLWIDKSSHNKLFICSPDLKVKVHGICGKHKSDELFDLSSIEDFFNNQADNAPLAFLREGGRGLLRIDENLIEKAMCLVKFWSSYDVISFGDKEKEEYTGPNDLKACVCRFCRRGDPKVKFKKRNAHAIPEALGNKLIFCNDECPDCNVTLSHIDKELAEYLKYRRSEGGIRNKKSKIIKVYGHNFFYDGSSRKLKISPLAILEEKESEYYVKLEGAERITHLGIYKALAKIAIDLMPRNLVDEFQSTIDWIKGEFVPQKLPNVFYIYQSSSVSQPLVQLFVRHDETLNLELPRCIVALTLIDLTFLFIVPLGKDEPIYTEDDLKDYLKCIIPNAPEQPIDRIDMADRIGKYAHVKEWVSKDECEIVDQSEFNQFQEKNPNQVDFPEFDPSLVKILDCQISTCYLSPKVELTNKLRIEDSIVNGKMTDLSIDFGTTQPVLECSWEIEIQAIDNRETVLKTECKVVVSHECISRICSIIFEEISSVFLEYLVDEACKDLGRSIADKFHEYDFLQLARFLMESQGLVPPTKESAEQSVMTRHVD
jgi:hypothetical protein